MNYRFIASALAGSVLLFATSVRAGEKDFQACDGYPAPTKKSDGIVKGAFLWGLATGTSEFRRDNPALGLGGEARAACDRALADPLLLPTLTTRRSHLLQAKAFHALFDGAYSDALTLLDESDKAGPNDAYFRQSVVVGNAALRSLALYRMGKAKEAESALQAVDQARPYALSLRNLARVIRLNRDGVSATFRNLLTSDLPYDPGLLTPLFWDAMLQDDHRMALVYSRQITFEMPKGRGSWTVDGEADRPYNLIKERAELNSATAYARLATGDAPGAEAAMAAVYEDLEDAKAPPVANRSGKVSKRARADYDARVAAGNTAKKDVDGWALAISLRKRAPGMGLEEVARELQLNREVIKPVTDILKAARISSAEERAVRDATLARINANAQSAVRQQLSVDMYDLLGMLPRPEIATMQPKYQTEGSNILRSNMNGYDISEGKNGLTTVRFGSQLGTIAMIEEAAMIAAARHVEAQGGESFVIETRQAIQRSLVSVYYGVRGGETPSGHEVRLGIRIYGAGGAPNGDLGPRVFRAKDVIAALAPRFPIAS